MRRRKRDLEQRITKAKGLRAKAEDIALEAAAIASEQRTVSDALKEQRRLNHFSEILFGGIPRRTN